MKLQNIFEARYDGIDIISQLKQAIRSGKEFQQPIGSTKAAKELVALLVSEIGQPTRVDDKRVYFWQYPETQQVRSKEDEGELVLVADRSESKIAYSPWYGEVM